MKFRLRAKDKCKQCEASMYIDRVEDKNDHFDIYVKCERMPDVHNLMIQRRKTGREKDE